MLGSLHAAAAAFTNSGNWWPGDFWSKFSIRHLGGTRLRVGGGGDPLGVRSKCNVNVWKVFTFWSQQQQRRRIGAAAVAATAASERREGPLWAARNGWVGPPYLRANIAISCQPCASIYCSRWYVHAAQNEPIMNIFHCRGRGTSEHAETIWDPRGVDQAKAH